MPEGYWLEGRPVAVAAARLVGGGLGEAVAEEKDILTVGPAADLAEGRRRLLYAGLLDPREPTRARLALLRLGGTAGGGARDNCNQACDNDSR